MKTGFLFFYFLYFFFCCRPSTSWPVVYKSPKEKKPSIMSESDTMFNERDLKLYNSCALPIQVMRTGPLHAPSKCKSGLPRITGTCPGWWKQRFRLRLWSLVWFQVRATSCHLMCSKSAWKSTPKCTWVCWRVWWSPGAIRWPVAEPGCGSRTRRRPTSPKETQAWLQKECYDFVPFYHWPPSSPDLNPQDYFIWSYVENIINMTPHNTKASLIAAIRRVIAGACGKGFLPVPDPYGGGDWGWRRLYWIDVSSPT